MKGKSWEIPAGMVFGEFYCSKCGARLQKEKTHRVVTKDDKDCYRYQRRRRCDYDVYDYRFMCPLCGARIAYDEQCIIKKIQKKNNRAVLSSAEIRESYKECKHAHNKNGLFMSILAEISFWAVGFLLYFLFGTNRSTNAAIVSSALFFVFSIVSVTRNVRSFYKDSHQVISDHGYSQEKEMQIHRLHAYSSHNRNMVDEADRCYCFFCKGCVESSEIVDYTDGGKTAVCPLCGKDTLIPDSIGEPINDTIVREMNEYWF